MRKIAIIRRNGLGDLLCSFPLINYLKWAYPSAQITIFLDPSNAPLANYLKFSGKIVTFPKTKNKYLQLLSTALRYRKEKFDLAISAKTSPMKLMNLFLFALGAKKRVAYAHKNHWSSLLVNQPLYYDRKEALNKHQALKALQLVAPHLKTIPPNFLPKIATPTFQHSEKHVLISASTTQPTSRLDVKRYAQLVNKLHAQMGPFITRVVSLAEDEARAKALASELSMPYCLHFPNTFVSFMRILGDCSMFFCGDGGIGHIAAAMGQPCVVLFGEVRPVEWIPLGDKVQALYDPIHVNRLSDEVIFNALVQAMQQLQPMPAQAEES